MFPFCLTLVLKGLHKLVDDVITDLELAVATLTDHGLQRSSVLLDPGIGFAKTAGQSIDLVRNIEHIRHRLKSPILIGTSRKSFIGSITEEPVADRKFGTAATVALAIKGGVDVVRVQDVKHKAVSYTHLNLQKSDLV